MSEPLISLSQAAIEHIKKIIENHESGSIFRLAVKQTGCSGYMYVPEVVAAPKDEDIEIHCQDDFIMYVDASASSILQGTYIDFVAKDFGMEQLEYDNPNADSLCGCGESFNLKESD